MYKFRPITDRVKQEREKYRNTIPYIDITRYKIVTEFYMENQNLTGILKRAYNFKNMCEKMPVFIRKDDLIVGNYVGSYRATALYPENSVDWLPAELKNNAVETREVDPYKIKEEDKEYVLSTIDFWNNESMNAKLNPYIPEHFSEIVAGGPLFFTPKNICPQPVGHFVPNYQKAIRVGFGAIKKEAEDKMIALEENGFMGSSAEQYSFYRSVAIVSEGIILFAKRYEKACLELAEKEKDPKRKKEWEQIADTMGWIMEKPARNFRDAIQALWFYQMCVLMDANMHGTSLGRFDQYLGEYAENDLKAGVITEDEMQEMIDLYYLKVAEMNKIWSARTARSAPGYSGGQLFTLGGVDENGHDASNIITYMGLEAVGRLQLHNPSQALRIHKNTPKKLWQCALSVNKIAGGVPAFFSDETIRPALEKRGIRPEDTWKYTPVGCVEPSIGGEEWPACGGIGISSYLNMVNVLLLAINNGKNYKAGMDGTVNNTQFGPQTGYLYEMNSIEDVKCAYLKQLEFWVRWHVNAINMFESIACNVLPQPLVSAMMEGCMEKGTDVMKGGAKYNSTGHIGIGIGNVTDCLNIIEKLCFNDKVCSTKTLYNALINNWQGYETLHQMILHDMPRYGNGIKEADKTAVWVAKTYSDLVTGMSGPRGNYAAGLFPVTMNVVYGALTGASPDGRVSGEPLADGISAMQGMDRSGPTAILRSVTSFDHTDFSNGILLNMKFHPTVLSNEDGFDKLQQLMHTYFCDMGGMEMQLNIVSADTLKDAQKHPENYKDLVVRIAGFSAYFVEVFKGMQDDLIRRTELGL